MIGTTYSPSAVETYAGSRMADAIVQPIDLAAGLLTRDLWLYAGEVRGRPRYAVEICRPLDPQSPAIVVAPPNSTHVATGWTTVGAADPKTALGDGLDTSYVLSTKDSTVQLTLFHLAAGSPFASKRISHVKVKHRVRAAQVGARWRAVLVLNTVSFYGPWHSASMDGWVEAEATWSYNPQGFTLWPAGDAVRLTNNVSFAVGIQAEKQVQAAKQSLEIGTATENRVGSFATGREPVAGWNRLVMDANLDANPYSLALYPVIANLANYATFPLLAPKYGSDALAIHERDTNGLVTLTKIDKTLELPRVLVGQTSAVGLVYRGGSVRAPNDLGDSLAHGSATEYQLITGDGSTHNAVAITAATPDGKAANLDVAILNLPSTVLATATITVESKTPKRYIAYLSTSVTLTAAESFAIRFASTASSSLPWRIARLDGISESARETLQVLPAVTLLNDGWTSTEATMHQAVDDPIGSPDDDTTYVQQNAVTPAERLIFQSSSLAAVTGRTIASVSVVARVGSGQATAAKFVGILRDHTGTTDYRATAIDVATGWNMVEAIWTTNPATALAWTAAQVQAFASGGAWGFGFEANPGDMLCTQTYLRVSFSDGSELIQPLSIVGKESTNPGVADKTYSDLAFALGTRPANPSSFVLTPSGVTGSVVATYSNAPVASGTFTEWRLYRTCNDGTKILVAKSSVYATQTLTDYSAPIGIASTYTLVSVAGDFESSGVAAVTTVPGQWNQLVSTIDPTLSVFFAFSDDYEISHSDDMEAFVAPDGFHSVIRRGTEASFDMTADIVLAPEPGWQNADAMTLLSRLRKARQLGPMTLKIPGRFTVNAEVSVENHQHFAITGLLRARVRVVAVKGGCAT